MDYDIDASGFVLTRSARVSSVMLVSLTLAQLTVTNFTCHTAPKLAMTHNVDCTALVMHDVGICCVAFRPHNKRSKFKFDVIGDYIGVSGLSVTDATCGDDIDAGGPSVTDVTSRHGYTKFELFQLDEIGGIATTCHYASDVWTLGWTVRCFSHDARKLIDLYQMGGDTEKHVIGLLHWFSVTFQHDGIVSQQMVSKLFASDDDICVSGTAPTMIEYGGEATLVLYTIPSDEKVAAYLCMETSDETSR